MKITELKCTSCNGSLKIDENNPHIAVCEYCKTRYVLEDEGGGEVHLGGEEKEKVKEKEIWYEPAKEKKVRKTGWEPYGWKRGVALVSIGLVLMVAMNWKGLKRRWDLDHAQSKQTEAAASLGNDAVEVTEAPEEAFKPLEGTFADMASKAVGKPADALTEADLGRFRWVTFKYSMDSVMVGYSFDNPYESEDAELTWLEYPRDSVDLKMGELSKFKGLKKLDVANYMSADSLKGLDLVGLSCYSKTPGELAALMEDPGQIQEINFKAGLESLDGLSEFTGIDTLTIGGMHLTDIKDLANLKQVKSLTLENCDDVTDFTVLSVMDWLEELSVESESIKDTGFVKGMPSLHTFRLSDAKILNLNGLEGNTTITTLAIEDCREMKDAGTVSGLTGLKNLSLDIPYGCAQPDLSGLSGLESLEISGMDTVKFLGNMAGLTHLNLSSCKVDSTSVFSGLTNLKELKCTYISGNDTGWGFVAGIPGLEILDLRGISTYEDISGIFNIASLKELYLNGMECELNFSKLAPNESLEVLEMDGMKFYTNVQVSGGGGIVYVDYDKVELDGNTDFLANYPGLKHLSIADNKLTQIQFAGSLAALETLDISDNYVTDLKPLEPLRALYQVNCKGNPVENYRVLGDKVTIIQ